MEPSKFEMADYLDSKEMIPKRTQASLRKGNWLIHKDGENIIQIWTSNLSGKEKVFVNNELVSEKRNLKKEAFHEFSDENGVKYKVLFKTISISKGSSTCIIVRNEDTIKTFSIKYVSGKMINLKQLLIFIFSFLIFIIINRIFEISALQGKIYFAVLVVLLFIARKPGKMIIEE